MLPPVFLFKGFFCFSGFEWILEIPPSPLLSVFLIQFLKCHTAAEVLVLDTRGIKKEKRKRKKKRKDSELRKLYQLSDLNEPCWRYIVDREAVTLWS